MKYLSLKKSVILLSIGLLAGFFTILTGCVKQKFDEPSIIVPKFIGTSNMTIANLKKKFVFPVPVADTANFVADSTGTMIRVKGDIILQGVISANDESGNIYKQLFIQDSTGGIELSIDRASLYTEYKVGQRVFVKCKGLYIGQYGSATQIGYPFTGSIGRMPSALLSTHLFLDSLPGKAPVPVVIDITQTNSDYFDKFQGMLVSFHNVSFSGNVGSLFAPGTASQSYPISDSIDQPILLPNPGGNALIIYSSSYASFAKNRLPSGLGTIQGIFTLYNTTYEMLIRDTKDLINFPDTLKIFYQNGFETAPSDWTIFTKSSNKPWLWSSSYTAMTANGYGGNAPCETWLISRGLNLSGIVYPTLFFNTWTKYSDSGLPNPLDVKISTDYSGSGDPSTATWTALNCKLSPANSSKETSSGYISLSAFNNQNVFVAFRYRSSGTGTGNSSSWELTSFNLAGKK
jgi:hypothetical protein